MKAALMERGRIWVDDVPNPVPRQGELLVKSLACGICGSDLHAARYTEEFVETSREAGGAFKLTTYAPVVLGHEFCAEVLELGPEVPTTFKAGDLVCSIPALPRDRVLGVGYSDEAPGGFGEYMVLSAALSIGVPGDTPVEHAALTEPIAVGLHAVNKAALTGREAALIIGCGPVGLAVLISLKHRGIGPIVAADFSPTRRRLAEQLGADVCIDPSERSPYEIAELKRPQDVVIFECVGVPGMLDQVFLSAPQNARIVVVGVCLQMDHARPLIAINKELSVQYVLGYSVEEFAETLRLIADGAYDVAPLITGRVPLDGVAAAFDELADPERHAKILVEPWS
jgi:threonine dehydrogenase-like Zn-dependent dehydrogenase